MFGFSSDTIYLWRPPDDGKGCLFAVGGAWGNGAHSECSTQAKVYALGIYSNFEGQFIIIYLRKKIVYKSRGMIDE